MRILIGKKILIVILVIILFTTIAFDTDIGDKKIDKITILYTNDIHCSVEADENTLGFADLSGLKKQIEESGSCVTLVDCGDAVSKKAKGAFAGGTYMFELMNEQGYDICTFGNHEFYYGMNRISDMTGGLSNAEYVSCNLIETETGNTLVKPYVIRTYGNIKIAYVGINTPDTIKSMGRNRFLNAEGKEKYNFCQGDDGKKLYSAVQTAVNNAKEEGADYIVSLAHLGTADDSKPYRSIDVIANTTGIDVVLDGHSHSVIEREQIPDKEGKNVILSSTGKKLANIGCLTIDTKGTKKTTDDVLVFHLIDRQAVDSHQPQNSNQPQILSK